MSYIIKEHNTSTNEVIEREMTLKEIKEHTSRQISPEVEEAILMDKINKKNALLERLGITEDEAKLLLS